MIEDNPADAGLVREALQENGVACELIVISDGDKAIRFIQSLDARPVDRPGLVILDLNLPKRSGRETLEVLRHSQACGQTAIIVLSSSDAAQDKLDSLRLGATRYIRKPLRLEEFLGLGAVFRAMLDDARRQGG